MKLRHYSVSTIALLLAGCGGGGSPGNDIAFTPPPSPPADVSSPAVSFSASTLDVESGQTASVTLTASDNVGVTSGPVTSCTNGGSFSGDVFTAPNVTELTLVECIAMASDAAGNTGSAALNISVTPPVGSVMFSLNGTAFKGLVLGGNVVVVDAHAPETVLATGTTDSVTGQFDLDVTETADFTATHIRLTVSGGDDAQMICDAPAGCGLEAFGNPIDISEQFELSAIVEVPERDTARTVNLNIVTDMSAVLAGSTFDSASLAVTSQNIMELFGLSGANAVDIAAVDLDNLSQTTGEDAARLTFISGGLLQTLFERGDVIGAEYTEFKSEIIASNGELIVLESTNDTAVISLQDIYTNAVAIRPLITQSTANIDTALQVLDADITMIASDVRPDSLSELGQLPLTEDAAAEDDLPSAAFSPMRLNLESGEVAAVTLTVSSGNPFQPSEAPCTNGGVFANGMFTAPQVTDPITSICTSRIADTNGNIAMATFTANVVPAPEVPEGPVPPVTPEEPDTPVVVDTQDPVITFGHPSGTDFIIASGTSEPFTFTITDNIGVVSSDVECDALITFSDGQVTAAFTAVLGVSRCTVVASDAAGNTVRRATAIRITPSPNEPPQITFTPPSLTVNAGASAFVSLEAIDLHGSVVSGPLVTCTDGLTFENGTVTAPDVSSPLVGTCTATATDDEGLVSTLDLPVNIVMETPVIQGSVTFSRFGHNPETGGLDQDTVTEHPARGIAVDVINDADVVLGSAVTDDAGFYSVEIGTNIFENIRVRVNAEMPQEGQPDDSTQYWRDFDRRILHEETDTAALPGGTVTQRDVDLGLNDVFNALDVIYIGNEKLRAIDPTLVFPQLDVQASIPNARLNLLGIRENLSSHYTPMLRNAQPGNLLHISNQRENSDVWDRHVIAHIWTHYIENAFSRYDSIGQYFGGEDTDIDEPFDLRMAFSEGLANAMAGIILEDPIYKDSFIRSEATANLRVGHLIDLENGDSGTNPGWYNVTSIQNVIYDLFDENNETYTDALSGEDNQTLGLDGIFNLMRNPIHMETPYFASIFSFREAVTDVLGGDRLFNMFAPESIFGREATAQDEGNDGGETTNIPVYTEWTGEQIQLCSTLQEMDYGEFNLGIFKHVKFTVGREGEQNFQLLSSVEFEDSDPEMVIYNRGEQIAISTTDRPFLERLPVNLEPGEYILTVYDNDNLRDRAGKGSVCLDLTGNVLE